MKDTYKTISVPSQEILFKDRNSKFFGYAFPVKSEEDIKTNIETLKKLHNSARHWCYAYQIGTDTINYRVNDDGEPNNSAGMPIYGQIQSFDVTNVLIVVVRYFGGVKLGVGGLINAYKTAAQLALQHSDIKEQLILEELELKFEYKLMNSVMRIIKEKQLKIVKQDLELSCKIILAVRKRDFESVFNQISSIYGLEVMKMND
ncbi:YigZ family protein [Ichthyenterobacterium sp. W332]|uniref:YigZ family protein n=1 Tax=Microcosmobacter mediterraneus TaxID=3075607 RepID=A0ABU2YHB0_9FLAO|nr:YigZ family protein [Ichthyenterobacterium sp. W332]MDT0557521.1 YigZ family protein [Ichthyenterobacterium sp. W332]